ncbi:LOW QUALITY PROTEIN: hypothetical protein CVT26_003139 [Gymnopilus dilepis]|uniref:Uncharacterized protein n=1 Tax=Gymnopilus dilepis TaxID=231916 RepID=A0A409Y4K0_9AGAR|nr:LOW QUALITY PROTEIN: hypothetical protein CVT26_003139 [Gymnopilus dilepis]
MLDSVPFPRSEQDLPPSHAQKVSSHLSAHDPRRLETGLQHRLTVRTQPAKGHGSPFPSSHPASTRGPHRIQPRRYEAIERSMGCRSTNQQSRPSTTTLGIAPALATTPLSPAPPQATTSNRASQGKHLGDISAARIGSRGLESQCFLFSIHAAHLCAVFGIRGGAGSGSTTSHNPSDTDSTQPSRGRAATPANRRPTKASGILCASATTPSPSATPQTITPGSRNRGKRVGGVSARGIAWVGTACTCAPAQTSTPSSGSRVRRLGGFWDGGSMRTWAPSSGSRGRRWSSVRAGRIGVSGLRRGPTPPQPHRFEEGRPQPKVSRSRGRQWGGVWDGLRDMRTKGPSTRIQAAQGLKAGGGHVVAGLCACCEPLVSPTPYRRRSACAPAETAADQGSEQREVEESGWRLRRRAAPTTAVWVPVPAQTTTPSRRSRGRQLGGLCVAWVGWDGTAGSGVLCRRVNYTALTTSPPLENPQRARFTRRSDVECSPLLRSTAASCTRDDSNMSATAREETDRCRGRILQGVAGIMPSRVFEIRELTLSVGPSSSLLWTFNNPRRSCVLVWRGWQRLGEGSGYQGGSMRKIGLISCPPPLTSYQHHHHALPTRGDDPPTPQDRPEAHRTTIHAAFALSRHLGPRTRTSRFSGWSAKGGRPLPGTSSPQRRFQIVFRNPLQLENASDARRIGVHVLAATLSPVPKRMNWTAYDQEHGQQAQGRSRLVSVALQRLGRASGGGRRDVHAALSRLHHPGMRTRTGRLASGVTKGGVQRRAQVVTAAVLAV